MDSLLEGQLDHWLGQGMELHLELKMDEHLAQLLAHCWASGLDLQLGHHLEMQLACWRVQ